jgi:hypothetical protein
VTLCAAGINQVGETSIIAVCDRKISFWGGAVSGEGMAWKIRSVHGEWKVMFAGDTSPLVALIDAIRDAVKQSTRSTLRGFAQACSRAYRAERKNIIETAILSEYDIDTYAEYLGLKIPDRLLFDAITEKIKQLEKDWSLLFFGFDNHKAAHLFVITEHGRIQYCDIEGVAAIGSGAWAAITALTSYPYNRHLPIGEAVYSMLAAKYAAERSADGVGEDTTIVVLKPNQPSTSNLSKNMVKAMREKWKALPRIPEGAADELMADFKAVDQNVKHVIDLESGTLNKPVFRVALSKKSRTP